jgi:hypothetical protein
VELSILEPAECSDAFSFRHFYMTSLTIFVFISTIYKSGAIILDSSFKIVLCISDIKRYRIIILLFLLVALRIEHWY